PTFFFYCNTCNVLPGPAVGWGWCVGVVLRRGGACGDEIRGGGRAGASTASMGRTAGTAGTATTASTPPACEVRNGVPSCWQCRFHVLLVVGGVGCAGVQCADVGRSGYGMHSIEGGTWCDWCCS